MDCTKRQLEIQKDSVVNALQKYQKIKTIYEKCTTMEKDQNECKLIKNALDIAEWQYRSWETYSKEFISTCEKLDKYN